MVLQLINVQLFWWVFNLVASSPGRLSVTYRAVDNDRTEQARLWLQDNECVDFWVPCRLVLPARVINTWNVSEIRNEMTQERGVRMASHHYCYRCEGGGARTWKCFQTERRTKLIVLLNGMFTLTPSVLSPLPASPPSCLHHIAEAFCWQHFVSRSLMRATPSPQLSPAFLIGSVYILLGWHNLHWNIW